MKALLHANWFRLTRGKIFYIFLILSGIFALLLIAMPLVFQTDYVAEQIAKQPEGGDMTALLAQLNSFAFLMYGFDLSNGLGVLIVIATSLFIGSEYSTGVIHNKLSSGHRRRDIYLTNFVMAVVFALLILLVYGVMIVGLGIPLIGLGTDVAGVLIFRQWLAGVLITIVSVAVATFFSMIVKSMVGGILLNLGVVFGVTIFMTLVDYFGMLFTGFAPVADFLRSFVYVGQFSMLSSDVSLGYFLTVLFSSVFSVGVISVVGCWIFGKVDVR